MIVFTYCSKVGNVSVVSLDALSADSASLTLTGISGSIDSFTITYAGQWTVTVPPASASWMSVSETSGKGNKKIVITAQSINDSDSSRSAIILIKGEHDTSAVRILCTQNTFKNDGQSVDNARIGSFVLTFRFYPRVPHISNGMRT
jgi:VCBS repeat-containing protein